jgi:pimeloyl-ACP methyl ester carboxylesterase
MFMQSGPGVFRGDLSFYTRDDSLIGNIGLIDTALAPVHILCGEYDLTCTPEDATRTHMAIAGSTLEIMTELGHFPMSENPARFRLYFARALQVVSGGRAVVGTEAA